MVTVRPDAKEQFPIFFRWMNGGFYGSVAYNDRIMTAFFKWSNFSDSYDSRTYFKYGTPPLIGLISGSRACRYNSDGTPTGVYYGMTWSVDKIGINATLLDLFEKALDDRTDDMDLLIETVNGTVLHEMAHWSYSKNGPLDEKKKYGATRNTEPRLSSSRPSAIPSGCLWIVCVRAKFLQISASCRTRRCDRRPRGPTRSSRSPPWIPPGQRR